MILGKRRTPCYTYSVWPKIPSREGFQIPLKSPFFKGGLSEEFDQFPPLERGGRGDLDSWSMCHNGKTFGHSSTVSSGGTGFQPGHRTGKMSMPPLS